MISYGKPRYRFPDLRPSTTFPYRGGEFWIGRLGNFGRDTELLMAKIAETERLLSRPSSPSVVVFDLMDTKVTYEIARVLIDSLLRLQPRLKKIAFVGVSWSGKMNLKRYLTQSGLRLDIPFKYLSGLENAKEWLFKHR